MDIVRYAVQWQWHDAIYNTIGLAEISGYR